MPPAGPSSSIAGASEEESDFESYLLLLLSDSNLPTGGFVASSGLESFHAHGLLHDTRPTTSHTRYGSTSSASTSTTPKQRTTAPSQAQLSSATLSFAQSTLHSYSRSSFPFLARVHFCINTYLDEGCRARTDRTRARELESPEERVAADAAFITAQKARLEECLSSISRLDHSYHTLLLNHVARRASKAQGIALLTLYSKAFAKPIDLSREPFSGAPSSSSASASTSNSSEEDIRIELTATLVDKLKMDIRRTTASNTTTGTNPQNGHLPICWAVFSASLGLSLKKSVFLHLFLQARSLFSSSIRLNTLGPYLAHQVMRFQLRGVVESVLREKEREGCLNVPESHCVEPSQSSDKTRTDAEEPEKAGESMQVDESQAYTVDEAKVETNSSAESNPTLTTRKPKPFRTTASMSTITKLRPPLKPLREGKGKLIPVEDDNPAQGWAWDWSEEQDDFHLPFSSLQEKQQGEIQNGKGSERGFWTAANAPATTFPLGEIVQARHDSLHSRLFNS